MTLPRNRNQAVARERGARKVECRLAAVRDKEIELANGRITASVESRWSKRIRRAGLLRRLILTRMKRRAIIRALERAG